MGRHTDLEPLPPVEDLDFSTREVSQLWWFLDGAIMNVETRHHLWKSWGLCSRHSWGYAVMEVELRGGLPFSTTILHEDLMVRAARSLKQKARLPWSVARRNFESKAACFTCEYASMAYGGGAPGAAEKAELANKRARFLPLLLESRAEWKPATCPSCLGGAGPLCRQHLLAGVDPGERDQLTSTLRELARRLGKFKESMTWGGPEATKIEKCSWVEAVGWLSGWGYPAALLAAQGRSGRDQDRRPETQATRDA